MTVRKDFISEAEARQKAEHCFVEMIPYMAQASAVLDVRFLEAENCWMFFRNREIDTGEGGFFTDTACAVSKRGEVRTINDFSANEEELMRYLQAMSDHFGERGL